MTALNKVIGSIIVFVRMDLFSENPSVKEIRKLTNFRKKYLKFFWKYINSDHETTENFIKDILLDILKIHAQRESEFIPTVEEAPEFFHGSYRLQASDEGGQYPTLLEKIGRFFFYPEEVLKEKIDQSIIDILLLQAEHLGPENISIHLTNWKFHEYNDIFDNIKILHEILHIAWKIIKKSYDIDIYWK